MSIRTLERSPALSSHTLASVTGREPELSGIRSRYKPLIVHVNDDDVLLHLYSLVLERAGGFREKAFVSAQDAFEFCVETRPDLIMTDLVMPDINGLRFIEMLRSEPTLSEVPIILISAAYINSDSLMATYENLKTLWTPVSVNTLVETVRRMLPDVGND